MIAGLRGVVEEVGPDWLLVNVGGIMFQVFAPASTLSAIPGPGVTVMLYTHLQMREDGVTLYGFAGKAELQMFQLLLTVNGVGPRSALALLSAIPLEDLETAIVSDDCARLSAVPGIGKRTAARITLELKGKLGQLRSGDTMVSAGPGVVSQLLMALTSLGYSSAEAASAARSIPNLSAMQLEDALREALKLLSSTK